MQQCKPRVRVAGHTEAIVAAGGAVARAQPAKTPFELGLPRFDGERPAAGANCTLRPLRRPYLTGIFLASGLLSAGRGMRTSSTPSVMVASTCCGSTSTGSGIRR